jgi:tetratricopeptide (TPR) repeat protein
MMPRMRSSGCAVLLCLLLGCAAVSPRPESADATSLPVRELDEHDRNARDVHLEGAIQNVMLRRYVLAENEATTVLAIDPRSARARAVLGMARLQLAQQESPPDQRACNAAELEMHLARQLGSEDAFVGFLSAVFLAESGHMSAAAAEAEAALARTRQAPAADRASLLGIAGTYRYELGEEIAARPHLEAYVALRPDDAAAQFRLGASLLRIAAMPQGSKHRRFIDAQANAELAALAFERCFQLSPGDDDAAIAITTAVWRAAELAEQNGDQASATKLRLAAEQRLQTIAGEFPDNAEVWFRLGLVAEHRLVAADAETAYANALQRDAGHTGAALNLAALRLARGDESGAIGLWQRVLERDVSQPMLTARERKELHARIHAPMVGDAPR